MKSLQINKACFSFGDFCIDQGLKAMRDCEASGLSGDFLQTNQSGHPRVAAHFFPSVNCLKSATDTAGKYFATFLQFSSELFYKACGCIHVDRLAWAAPQWEVQHGL